MAPYQAFAIGGLSSVRGYGEGAVGSGRSCLVANSELTFPLVRVNLHVTLHGPGPACPVTVEAFDSLPEFLAYKCSFVLSLRSTELFSKCLLN